MNLKSDIPMHRLKVIMTSTATRLALVLMLLWSIVSCKSVVEAAVERVHLDSTYIGKRQYDSVFIADQLVERYFPSSFHYDTVMQAFFRTDTIYRDKVKTEFRYKLLRDTAYVQKVDTIPKVVTVVKTTNKPPDWCWVVLGLLVVSISLARYRNNP